VRQLCVIPGDGIGLEVVPAAIKVLKSIIPDLEIVDAEAGWDHFKKHGVSVPKSTLDSIVKCGAALFGAVSSPSYKVEGYRSAIITMRQELNLFANIRPVHSLPNISPRSDVDMIIVRENTEGLYIGREYLENDEVAIAERVISKVASRRIAKRAIVIAIKQNRSKITIVHKANILPITDGLFRDSVREVIEEHNKDNLKITINELLVDVAAYKIISDPTDFDIIVTSNLFGDILSDLAAYWCGGLPYASSINIGNSVMVAEPVHGSAPDIAGQGQANPIATILSAALLVRNSWGLLDEANKIEGAVKKVLLTSSKSLISKNITEFITNEIIGFL
jgi:homoisocitrate dehydrogenase